MATSTKTRKKKPNTQVPGNSSSGSETQKEVTNPVHQRGNLTYFQAIQEARGVHKAWVQEQLDEGYIIPLTWYRGAQLMRLLDFVTHTSYPELADLRDLGELQVQLSEPFPYDQEQWNTRRQFVCQERYLDVNGQPPAVGIIRLTIDPFKEKPPLLEVLSESEELDR